MYGGAWCLGFLIGLVWSLLDAMKDFSMSMGLQANNLFHGCMTKMDKFETIHITVLHDVMN